VKLPFICLMWICLMRSDSTIVAVANVGNADNATKMTNQMVRDTAAYATKYAREKNVGGMYRKRCFNLGCHAVNSLSSRRCPVAHCEVRVMEPSAYWPDRNIERITCESSRS
jgi:hypothetical protein